MAKMGRGKSQSYPKSDGKQGIKTGGDYGARKALAATFGPAWIKEAASGNFARTKHNEK